MTRSFTTSSIMKPTMKGIQPLQLMLWLFLPILFFTFFHHHSRAYIYNIYRDSSPVIGIDDSEPEPPKHPTRLSSHGLDSLPDVPHHHLASNRDNFASIMVFSARPNFAQRSAIRETWAKDVPGVTFFVGAKGCTIPQTLRRSSRSCNWKADVAKETMREDEGLAREVAAEQDLLEKEQRRYKDVVLLPMVDAYDMLSTKLMFALNWTLVNTNTDWVFKIDDDNYARINRLYSLAKACGMKRRVIGFKNGRIPVRKKGRFADLLYEGVRYPAYPNGGVGYGLTRDLVEFIVSNDMPIYPNEDTCIGIWLQSQQGIKYCWRQRAFHQDLRDSGKTCLHKGTAVVGHKFDAAQLRSCFERDTEK